MKRIKNASLLGIGLAALLGAQQNPVAPRPPAPPVTPAPAAGGARERVSVPFSDATAPRKLVVEGLIGTVTVRGYEGKEAVIEYTPGFGFSPRSVSGSTPPPGMHRIGGGGDMDVTEANNIIRVNRGRFMLATDLSIQVPVETSVTVNLLAGGGGIVLDNISGEIEASNMVGPVTVTNASGSVVAHSMSGKISVVLNKVMPDKSMSFSTMNGDIDVTLPADTKASLKMKTDNGDIFTDFDVTLDSTRAAPVVEEQKGKEGTDGKKGKERKTAVRQRVRFDSTSRGTINGGGPEMQFTTFNGRILIHKK
jgi:hypothetical protein